MTRSGAPVLILASESPRRAELLRSIGFCFEVRPAGVDERIPHGISPRDASLLAACAKSRAVAREYPECVVLGADTVVSIEDRIVGKPRDEEEARLILGSLSGRWHTVWTGICFSHAARGWEISDAVASRVKFRVLSQEEIVQYVATGEPLDKAGAYGIQGSGGLFVEKLVGSLDNVIGLPTERVTRILNQYYPDLLGGGSKA